MKTRAKNFNGAEVRSLLDGRKTQFRALVKPPKGGSILGLGGPGIAMANTGVFDGCMHVSTVTCPYGQPGDRLWVRESFCPIYPQDPNYNGGQPIEYDYAATYVHGYRLGDRIGFKKKWKPSIHMPRWASRIELEVTGVRVERLQDISEVDAIAEGIVECPIPADDEGPRRIGYMVGPDDGKSGLTVTAREAYRGLWESINGPESWEASPWVWVVEFKRVAPARAA